MVELYTNGAVAELADAHDSKSCELSLMWVRPPPAPLKAYFSVRALSTE